MSEPSYCEHDYRRDVETCLACELAEAEASLEAAREVARRLFRGLAPCMPDSLREALATASPWLLEPP